MRNLSLASFCGVLLIAAACGSSDTSEPGGVVDSQEDVQRVFESIMPDLVEAFTDLAEQLTLAASALPSSTAKGGGSTSTVPCPGGGTLTVDRSTGQATLTECGVGGLVISASLALFVSPTGPSSYSASFNGPLMVTGTFTGTIEVNSGVVQWQDPPSVETTSWDVTVTVNGMVFIASSSNPGNGMNGGDCDSCVGVNAAPPNFPTNNAVSCQGPIDEFTCECLTESGEELPFYLSGAGCLY